MQEPTQGTLFDAPATGVTRLIPPFKAQLLKWIGNKQRFAHEIASYFPVSFERYLEPFLGAGGVLGVLAPARAVASDCLEPLMGIWHQLSGAPGQLVTWYAERWERYQDDRVSTYENIKASFNAAPNAADLLFLSRSCYGGVVRFRKDGYMSTPAGVHAPITPQKFASRVAAWARRTAGARFVCSDFEETMDQAGPRDVVYCDPPYSDTQAILYGAQAFSLDRLYAAIDRTKRRGAFVALSIDGDKKSGKKGVDVRPPAGLFALEARVNCGVSQLRRFQRAGETLGDELVSDRLLLTADPTSW